MIYIKKIFIYSIAVLIILFFIPSISTKKRKENSKTIDTSSQKMEENIVQNENYEYTLYNTIKLYHTKTEEIEELPLDEYLYGVVSAEIPVSYDIEALKAQAVAARTYTIYQISHSKNKHQEADICDNFACCQAWISKEERFARWEESTREENWKKITKAVDETKGKIITYNGEPIDAFFHSNSGGTTETPTNVWGGNEFPYLQSVETSGEENYKEYSSYVEFTKKELIDKIKEKYPEIEINYDEEGCIQILEYTQSNRVKTIKFGNINLAGTEARSILGLKSTKFSFEITNEKIRFNVLGYGHGVGMSQTGANSLAKNGYSYEDILKHFYKDVEIKDEGNS